MARQTQADRERIQRQNRAAAGIANRHFPNDDVAWCELYDDVLAALAGEHPTSAPDVHEDITQGIYSSGPHGSPTGPAQT